MDCEFLVPYPQKLTLEDKPFPKPREAFVSAPSSESATRQALSRDLKTLAGIRVNPRATFRISLALKKGAARPEGYRLRLSAQGAIITSADRAGLFYGTQTLLQFLVLAKPADLRPAVIEDWPTYKLRSFMPDLGRAPFSLPLLKRLVRILARLKMNLLHLHITDDQLCSLRFRRLPLGSENPAALTLAQLRDLIRYAHRYHVRIMPEIECWGHAGWAIYHYPHLYGGPGMWGGMSFALGEETFDLFARTFDELLPVLDKDCLVHVGLDEAKWFTLPSVPKGRESDYAPDRLVGRLHAILDRAARKHNRRVTMHLWADHGGRPIPKGLRKKVVVEPWMYFECREPNIREKVAQYSGRHKTPFMMGGGMSSMHFSGHFGATRVWCQAGRNAPNCEGITICFWASNDLAGHLLGLYSGADVAWSPDTPALKRPDDIHWEYRGGELGVQMREWQVKFRDGDTEAINRDRGPEVERGFYCWGPRAGQPVAPTVQLKAPGPVADDEPT